MAIELQLTGTPNAERSPPIMMNCLPRIAVIVLLSAGHHIAHSAAFSFDSGNVPLGIGPNPSTTTSLLIPNATGTITDLDVFVDIDHTFAGELEIFIEHDNTGTIVKLLEFNVGSIGENDITGVTFDDEAATAILPGAPPYGPGSFSPVPGSLSDFDGEDLAGTWTLTIDDTVFGDSGTLQAWGIRGMADNLVMPDLGSTLLLLGLGLLGLFIFSRKTSHVLPTQ